jgi:hypothetical protein
MSPIMGTNTANPLTYLFVRDPATSSALSFRSTESQIEDALTLESILKTDDKPFYATFTFPYRNLTIFDLLRSNLTYSTSRIARHPRKKGIVLRCTPRLVPAKMMKQSMGR